jgi:hypothetical protein
MAVGLDTTTQEGVFASTRWTVAIWIVDAHRNEGKRLVVHTEEKSTAFLELESAIHNCVGNLTGCIRTVAAILETRFTNNGILVVIDGRNCTIWRGPTLPFRRTMY